MTSHGIRLDCPHGMPIVNRRIDRCSQITLIQVLRRHYESAQKGKRFAIQCKTRLRAIERNPSALCCNDLPSDLGSFLALMTEFKTPPRPGLESSRP